MAKLKGKAKEAFLRRMARGRNKKKRKKHSHSHESHHPKKRKRKKHTGGHHVAKKRKHSKKGRRRSHAGGLGKYIPPTDKLIGIGTAFAYGKVEAAATTDAQHVLKKVPALVPQIGRAGNLGAIAWLAAIVMRNQTAKHVASGLLHVAAYQNGRAPANAFSKDAQDFKLSGRPGRGRDELLVEEYLRRQGG